MILIGFHETLLTSRRYHLRQYKNYPLITRTLKLKIITQKHIHLLVLIFQNTLIPLWKLHQLKTWIQ